MDWESMIEFGSYDEPELVPRSIVDRVFIFGMAQNSLMVLIKN